MIDPPIAIVCALEFERRHLEKTLRDRTHLARSGPGPDAIEPCLQRLHHQGITRCILVGVAGGLRHTNICPPIGRIIDRQGRAWTPSLTANPDNQSTATVLALDTPVTEPDDKAALAIAHDADLADCESHAFARTAATLNMTWAVVRAISDGPTQRLPPQVLAWTDAQGVTRLPRVLADLARNPRLIPATMRLARQASRAMHAAHPQLDATIAAMENHTK